MWYTFPDRRGVLAWAQVQNYSTDDGSKDRPPATSDQDGAKSTKDMTNAHSSKDPAGRCFLRVVKINYQLSNNEIIQIQVIDKPKMYLMIDLM